MARLAIIEDHQMLREGLESLLGDNGLDVIGSAGTMADGLDLVPQLQPDVALVDIRLVDGSGIDLARMLLATCPGLRVVLYTSEPDAELLSEGLAAGAHGYALKTGSCRELAIAIAQVAAGGTYVDPRLDGAKASPRRPVRPEQLSPRERQVMRLMAEGGTAGVVGERLGVSVETVRTHVRNAVRKLRARNRVHAIALALERGDIELDPSADR